MYFLSRKMIKTFIQERSTTYLTIIALLFSFQSCRKENDTQLTDIQQDVSFMSSITGLPQTKAQGTQWDANDAISIFMYESGKPLSATSLIEGGDNAAYKTNGNGNFFAVDPNNKLKYPVDKKVDFVAFYPFQSIVDFLPFLDIGNQQDQSAIDYMLATVSDVDGATAGPTRLSFQRQMSKIEVAVKGVDAGSLKASFEAMDVEGELNLVDKTISSWVAGGDLQAKVTQISATESKVEWTVFPSTLTDANKIVFTDATGKTYTWEIGKDKQELVKGHRYKFDITLGKDGNVKPQPTASYFELPIITETPTLKYSMKSATKGGRRNFSMLYDGKQGIAHWVAYPLTKDYLGSQKRTDDWAYDRDYPNNWQANLLRGSYSEGNLDRGHQIPSGDRTANYAENAQTFLATNMTPQESNMNQQVWQALEDKVRTWMRGSGVDTMYVVTGAMATTPTNQVMEYASDKAGKAIAKPKYYYKALAIKKGTAYYAAGFKIPNIDTGNDREFMKYITTVAELEKETGYTFFPAMTAAQKAQVDRTIWKK